MVFFMHIRDATEADLPALLEIHNDAVKRLDAIWTEQEDTLDDRRAWLAEKRAKGFPVVVAIDEAGAVMGYASYGPYRPREGYRATVEHSVYVLPRAQGRGAGKALLLQVIDHARQAGFHAMVGGIESKNTGSIALHEKYGFKEVSRMPEVGQKHGRWLDLVQMQLMLDDRPAP
jgi:L-amino acid N-acyltransferase